MRQDEGVSSVTHDAGSTLRNLRQMFKRVEIANRVSIYRIDLCSVLEQQLNDVIVATNRSGSERSQEQPVLLSSVGTTLKKDSYDLRVTLQ